MNPALLDIILGGFSPTQIPGLALWLDAADASTVTLDGSNNVSQWNDKSGNGRHATEGTALNRPDITTINNMPAVRFDGVNDRLDSTFTILRGNTTHGIYWVFARLGAGNGADGYRPSLGQSLVTTDNSLDTGSIHFVKNSNNFGASYPYTLTGSVEGGVSANYDLSSGTAYVNNVLNCMSFQRNVTGYGVWRNGLLEGTTSAIRTPSNIQNGIRLGQQSTGAVVRYSNIAIAELLIYENVNSTIRLTIEAYLKAKWGTP